MAIVSLVMAPAFKPGMQEKIWWLSLVIAGVVGLAVFLWYRYLNRIHRSMAIAANINATTAGGGNSDGDDGPRAFGVDDAERGMSHRGGAGGIGGGDMTVLESASSSGSVHDLSPVKIARV